MTAPESPTSSPTETPSPVKRTIAVLSFGAVLTAAAFVLPPGNTNWSTKAATIESEYPQSEFDRPPVQAPPTTTTVPPPPPTTTTTAPPLPTTTTAPPPPPPPPPPAPVVTSAAPSGGNGDPNDPATWDRLADCESGGNWATNTGNGYYGGIQFSLGTWEAVGGVGYPHEASKAEQINRGKILQASSGWGQWPACTRLFGWR